MTIFIIQSLLLIAIAFVLGCLFGMVFHKLFGANANPQPSSVSVDKKQSLSDNGPVDRALPKPTPVESSPQPMPEPDIKDDLKRIRGVGPQNEARLNGIGVYTFEQIAAWSADEQKDIGERLSFPGRIEREEWVAQAATLAGGGTTDFADRVDRGEVESSTGTAEETDQGGKPPILNEAPQGADDDLTQISGVGDALEKKLNVLGIYTIEQISKWTKDHQVWIGNEIGFPGRPEREEWVTEAKSILSGETNGTKKAMKGEIKAARK